MKSLVIRLFGYPQLSTDDSPIQVERRKTLALVAYLAGDTPKSADSHGRETLATLLWPDGSQEQAAAYLRQALWDFNKAAGEEWIIKDGQAIRLNPQANIWVDIHHFEAAVKAWKTSGSSAPGILTALEGATALYRGDFLAGFTLRDSPAFDDWQALQTERLRLHFGLVLEASAQLYAAQNRYEHAIHTASRWLELDALNEAAHRLLMKLYEESGQCSIALRQYETCQNLIKEELGVEPEPATVAFYKQIRAGQIANPEPRAAPPKEEISQPLEASRPARPTGTVTFLFTDIEGSTRLWEHFPTAMGRAHHRQEAIIREAMAAHGGYIYKMIGDAFQVAFSTASRALAAALEAQRALQTEAWGEIGALKVRMGLHTCVTEERPDDYLGPELNRAARLMSVGHGGQVLLSQAVHDLVHDHLPTGISLRDLGEKFLKDLTRPEHIYQLAASGIANEFPPLKTSEPRTNIPVVNTPFVGRETELAQIETLLGNPECRLISLVGIGGSGKTRLVIQAASQSQFFRGRACFAGLAATTSLDDLIATLADALKVSFLSPPTMGLSLEAAKSQILNYLADKKLLFVLDNFEQLIGHTTFLAEILESAPQVKLLVSSRERLNLPGEWVLEIAGLPYPPKLQNDEIPQYAAVQMFVKVAERSGHFAATESDWPAIAKICQLLEGMPLGIEMAAAWSKMLCCGEIAAEIERSLDFLTASWRGIPERHQTLRAVFDYSWCLLAQPEREAFCKLAVFQGGFSREAAIEVANASLALLTALVDKSLIRRVSSGRFDIHPVLKQYAAQKLAEHPALLAEVQTRHALYYSEWLLRKNEQLKSSELRAALAALQIETQNLRLARQTLLKQHNFTQLEQILPAILLFDVMNDQQVETREMAQWLFQLESDLRAGENDAGGPRSIELLAITLAALHPLKLDPHRPEMHKNYQHESLQLASALPDSQGKAFIYLLNCIGPGLEPNQTFDLCQQSAEIFERLNDPWGIGLSLLIKADAANFSRIDETLARQAYQNSAAIFATLKNDWGLALCSTGQTFLEYQGEHFEAAYHLGQQSLELLTLVGNFERQLHIRHVLGEIALALEKPAEARQYFRSNLAYYLQVGDQKQAASYTERLARIGRK